MVVKQTDRQVSRFLKMKAVFFSEISVVVLLEITPGSPVEFRRDNRPVVSRLHPAADDRHDHVSQTLDAVINDVF